MLSTTQPGVLDLILAVLLTGAACQTTCASDDSNVSVAVRPASAYVAGLPMPLEVVVMGKGRFAAPDVLHEFNPLDIRFTSATEEYRFHPKLTDEVPGIPAYEPHLQIRTIPAPKVRIAPGEESTFVLDLSNLDINIQISQGKRTVEKPDALEPGDYKIVVEGQGAVLDSGPKTIKLVAPNAEERRFLDRVYALPPTKFTWRSFVIQADAILDGIQIDQFSELGRRQLQYHLVLAQLVHSDLDVADLTMNGEDIEGLWPAYQTDVLILRYEIALAANQARDAQALRALILLSRPAARHQLNRFESTGGLISALRKDVER